MCDKSKFFAKRIAIKVAKKMKNNGKVPARKFLRAYYCEKCKAWHLTKMELQEYRNKNKKP